MSSLPLEGASRRGRSRATDPDERRSAGLPRRVIAVEGPYDPGALFPSVRRGESVSAIAARRSVPAFDVHASPTTWIVGDGLRLLDAEEQRRIVAGWRTQHVDWPGSLVTDGGCDVRLVGEAVAASVRSVLLEWLPISRTDLAAYESGLFRNAPAEAVALLVRPPTIWSIDEAMRAERRFPRGRRFSAARFEAIAAYARERVGSEQLERLRAVVGRIELQLPVDSFPVASATVAAGCVVVARSEECAVRVVARQLARYSSSSVVARERERREPLVASSEAPVAHRRARAATVARS